MAREIEFRPVAQADFSNANSLYALSAEQFNKALATAQNTVNDFSKAVTARNDATIKNFINSLPKDELINNPDKVNNFIKDIGLTTGNMYSAGDIENYRDNRVSTLIARDNANLENQENKLKIDEFAKEVLAKQKARTVYDLRSAISSTQDPEIKAILQDKLDNEWLSLQDMPDVVPLTELAIKEWTNKVAGVDNATLDLGIAKNEKQDKYQDTKYLSLIPQIATLAAKQQHLLANLFNPNLSPESKAQLEAELQKINDMLGDFEKVLPASTFNKTYLPHLQQGNKAIQDATKEANNFIIKQGQLEVSRQNADTQQGHLDVAVEKLAREDGTGASSGNKKPMNDLDKQLANLGYISDISADSRGHITTKGQSLGVKVLQNISNFNKKLHSESKSSPISLEAWLASDEGQRIKQELDRRGFHINGFGFDSNYTNILEGFKANAKENITDKEKIAFLKAAYNEEVPIDDFTTFNDGGKEQVAKWLKQHRMKEEAQILDQSQKEMDTHLTLLSRKTGLNKDELLWEMFGLDKQGKRKLIKFGELYKYLAYESRKKLNDRFASYLKPK